MVGNYEYGGECDPKEEQRHSTYNNGKKKKPRGRRNYGILWKQVHTTSPVLLHNSGLINSKRQS